MQIGDLWNGWKIDRFIGEGSFGKVYRIIREEFGHTYEAALKVLEIPQNQSEVDSVKNEGMDDESVTYYFRSIVEEFVEEFALMSKLKGNSNIVSYEDHQVVAKENAFGWTVYIRMELLTPLYTYLRGHTLTIREVIQLGIDMCQALETCQKYNIIHRDIKPENIFVSDLGKFKLGDFGIARQLEKTSSGLSKKGTYAYMAPEVYKGLPYNSTVDIYSLGIVLYRFLNDNRTPFMPPSPQPIRFSDKENANILRLSGKEMPNPANAEGRLAEIILKACAYEPSNRYESAFDMRKALQSIAYSETEARLIYPEGDGLSNTMGLGYVSDNADLERAVHNPDIQDTDKTGTVYLFRADQQKKEEKVRREAEERAKREAEERARREAEERARQEAEERALREEEERAQYEAGEQAEQEAIEQAEREAIEHTRREAEEKEEQEIKEQIKEQKKKTLNKKVIAAVAAVFVLVIFAGGIKVYQDSLKCEMPELVNMKQEKAEQALKKVRLGADMSEEYSDTIEKGYVISQEYRAGDTVKKGTSVKLIISKGALIAVPDLVNISQKDAQAKAESLGLSFEVKEEAFSDEVAVDMVISQEPEAGTKVEENSKVCVVLSKGIEKVEVPLLEGLTKKEAKAQLAKAQLKYKLSEEQYSTSVKKGKVISQSIKAGEKTEKNTVVSVVVSKGEEPAPEPVQADPVPYNTQQAPAANYVPPAPSAPAQNNNSGSGGSSGNNNEDSLDSWDLVN